MDILYYSDLDYSKVENSFLKVSEQLRNGNFAGADVKKMSNTGYYRAKLDDASRLLFKFARYENRTYLLLLEVILHHNYAGSRFLKGAAIDETKFVPIAKPEQIDADDIVQLPFINAHSTKFQLLDKVISFDEDQQEAFQLPAPLLLIGSAGSGKTILTLEKIKTLRGKVLYVTLSPYLVENSANLYYAFQYHNKDQETDFLSFKEYVETLQIPPGKELGFAAFDAWFSRYRNAVKLRDSYKLYEEFKGVLTGMQIEKEYLSREDYLALGVRQSVFLPTERAQVYDIFEKYLEFLRQQNFYDLSMVAWRWQSLCKPKYDFIIVDEVQDLTNTQLLLLLRSLKTSGQFVLCGDSNQVVHPNFFSWTNIKTMFYSRGDTAGSIRILRTNYRNSPQVTDIANKLLKLKNARFGSIDRESTYLVNPVSEKDGEVVCLPDDLKIKEELDRKTRNSTQFAVVVMRNEDKDDARKFFQTPLLFSVQEAKGLEYENIILFNFVHNKSREFIEITQDVSVADLASEEISYARGKDKTDKSFDAYKFYINTLYVAMTRAVRNLYMVESSQKHPLLDLLGLAGPQRQLNLDEQKSSFDEWQREAQRLELQGKTEQAEHIRQHMLGYAETPWTPVKRTTLESMKADALHPELFNKKAKDRLFDYALIYNDTRVLLQLSQLKYRKADKYEPEQKEIFRRVYAAYSRDDVKKVAENIKKYGIDYRDEFNLTPLLAAIKTRAVKITDFLIEQGAKTDVTDALGMTPFLIALQQAHNDAKFLENRLPALYHKLQPDFVKVKIDNQLVKIAAESTEFFLLQNFIAYYPAFLEIAKQVGGDMGYKVIDVMTMCQKFPDTLFPEYRKKRGYLTAVLSRNEKDRKDPNSKKLFLRLARGTYVLNPDMELSIGEDEWINVYDVMFMEKMTSERNEVMVQEISARLMIEEERENRHLLSLQERFENSFRKIEMKNTGWMKKKGSGF